MNGLSSLELAFLTKFSRLNRNRLKWLRDHCDSLPAAWEYIRRYFTTGKKPVTSEQLTELHSQLESFNAEELEAWLVAHHIHLLDQRSPDFPEPLKHIPDPPLLLFAQGQLELLRPPGLAIVGTRKHTAYGETATAIIIRDLPRVTVVSGGAYGIDQLAHELALNRGLPGIIVLGMGLLAVSGPLWQPAFMAKHADQLLFLSEYWPRHSAHKYTFPERNRIISGLARAVIVVEAPRRSGALITAEYAVDQGREVIAVPGPIHQAQSQGTNQLLIDGATPYHREYLDNLFADRITLSEPARRLLRQLATPIAPHTLTDATLLPLISRLELQGLIKRDHLGRLVATLPKDCNCKPKRYNKAAFNSGNDIS